MKCKSSPGHRTDPNRVAAQNVVGLVIYNNATFVSGATNTYRVAAVSGAWSSAYSNTTSIVVPPVPVLPSNFTAVNSPNGNGNNRTVILNWSDNSNNETGFTIQRATTEGIQL